MEHTNFNTAQERISWVDAFKGLCIVMMVWGHTGAPGTAYIYLFHIPAFFILSGYTQKLDVKHPFRMIGKRFLTLFVPYFVINEGFFALYSILNRMGLYSYVLDTPPTGFVQNTLVFLQWPQAMSPLGGATWFLLVLFFAQTVVLLLQFAFSKTKHSHRWVFLSGALVMGIGWICIERGWLSRWTLDLGFFAVGFVVLGMMLKHYRILECKVDSRTMAPMAVVTGVLIASFFFKDGLVNWPVREFIHPLLYLAGAWSGFYLSYLLIQYAHTAFVPLYGFFQKIGQRTFSILCGHFLTLKIATLLLALCGLAPFDALKQIAWTSSCWWLYEIAVSVALCCGISVLAEKNALTNYLVNAKLPKRKESVK